MTGNEELRMGQFGTSVTHNDLYDNEDMAANFDSNASLLLDIYKNISSLLEAIRSENNKKQLLAPIRSTDSQLRQENYIV